MSSASDDLRSQWSNPTDIFSVLLIVGGDVVRQALAQLAGGGPLRLPPVAFSFGWVAYSFTTLMSAAVGGNYLMPPADWPCLVINCDNGVMRTNQSWILGRLVRDYDHWMAAETASKLSTILHEKAEVRSGRSVPRAGLCVATYELRPVPKAKHPATRHDMIWMLGLVVAVVQLAIATIPWGLYSRWETFLVTSAGIFLAFAWGALPQWRREKWACRWDGSKKTIALTEGNGSRHAIVVFCPGGGLDLEDLATGNRRASPTTRFASFVSVSLWVGLLITASSIKENAWYLFAVGALGTLQNCFAAAKARQPSVWGLSLEYRQTIASGKVMQTLKMVEETEGAEGVGKALLPIFFPAGLSHDEREWWDGRTTTGSNGGVVSAPSPAVGPSPSKPSGTSDSGTPQPESVASVKSIASTT